MALPVLDGNQSATTLSSVVTGGEHIVAHSVVSLGTTAISNINSAVSGAVVTIPGLSHLGNSVATDGVADATTNFIKIGGHQSGSNQTSHIVHVSAGGSMSVDASGSSVTFSQAPVTFGAITGSASILNFPSTQTVAGTVTVGASSVTFNSNVAKRPDGSWQPLSVEAGSGYVSARVYQSDIAPFLATVTVGNSVTIAGTVTANGGNFVFSEFQDTSSAKGVLIGFEDDASTEYRKVTDAQPLPISISAINNTGGFSGSLPVSGTVTANVFGKDNTGTPQQLKTDAGGTLSVSASGSVQCVDEEGLIFGSDRNFPISGTVTVSNSVTIGSLPAISGTVTVSAISTSVTARLVDSTGTAVSYAATGSAGTPSTDVISVQGVSGGTSLPISGTAGTLTTRFGSVTTANTAQISSAVTNTSRKYLLIQNVTTSSNVITIGIGFTPTTTQGIQLTAGAGITFESSYIPTGAVYVLSSVTASPFTILEA